jgi:hypothetical protein
MDPLTQAYMQIINEESDCKVKTNLKVGAAFGHSENEKNASNFIKDSGPEDVEDLEDAEEAPKELTSDVDSSLKKAPSVKGESKNPFDALFNKIVSEETFNFSTEDDNELEPSNAFEDTTMGLGDEEAEEDLAEFDDENEESGEEVTLTLDKDLASKLIEVLQAALGDEDSEEGEMEEGDEEGEEDEIPEDSSEMEEGEDEEDETLSKESFALDEADKVNVDSAVKKLTSPKSHKVEGTLSKVKGKSASVPATGKGSNKPMKAHNTKPAVSKLTKKKQDVEGSSIKKGDEYFK